MKKIINVVAAIIENDQSEILCALRSPHMSHPNMWEFPGGKVEKDEDIFSALEREITEELGCQVQTDPSVYHENTHEYDFVKIHLISIKCRIIQGTPIAKEHSKFIWLKRKKLDSLKWAPADLPIVQRLIQER